MCEDVEGESRQSLLVGMLVIVLVDAASLWFETAFY